MQGATSAPAASAAEPPCQQQIKEDVISEAKIEADDKMKSDEVKLKAISLETPRHTRTISIDSDNRSDKSEEEESRRALKRLASPCLMDAVKRIARLECEPCRLRFDSANAYELHRFTTHKEDTRAAFNMISESKNVVDYRFKCDRCSADFPCIQALDIHRTSCSNPKRIPTPDRNRRDDFFAKLDLRNRSFGIAGTLTPPMERFTPKENGVKHMDAARDLADIQSILNVTSASSLLERLTNTRVGLDNPILTPPDTGGKDRDQEETQDSFAAEFRRMKLRGEFPCRLCPMKFPNLRALKGHNRVHLNGNGSGPYRCNMCPHASLDKAALIRHMRTHNGDRPYECAVCNYAFTTKANCERHLRNRHSKITREDVKRSIIYHPSEDPNNDDVNSKITREEVKRSLAFHTPEPEQIRRSEGAGDSPLSHYGPTFLTDRRHISLTPSIVPENIPTVKDTPIVMPRIKVKGIGQLNQIPEFKQPEISFKSNDVEPDDYDEDSPVDLSINDNNNCDVLDLSKKKEDSLKDIPKPPPRTFFEQDSAAAAMSAFEKSRLFFNQQNLFENSLPKLDTAYYAQLSQLYAGGLPGLPGLGLTPSFPINPYFLQQSFFPHPNDSQELVEMKQKIQKEIIRGLNMSGGRIVPGEPDMIPPKQEIIDDDQRSVNSDNSPAPPPMRPESPHSSNNTNSSPSDSVRLVIRNGVLIPKQKQRRYRTERPFSCSQCSARFTLRSNMERHIKQQHPQHWSIRRPAPRAPSSYPTDGTGLDNVKFALLARHLERPIHTNDITRHSPVRRDSDEVADNEDDEEDTLIIDEEETDIKKSDEHIVARKVAAEILFASQQQEKTKDFDLKIAGNLINKPPTSVSEKVKAGTDPINSEPLAVPIARSDEEEDEEGLVASTSEGNNSGSDENKSETDTNHQPPKKKSAYSSAPNRVSCPYCHRKFPWSSSLRRHVLTHTGQKPFKCPHCTLLFTTKSNCDRHLLRKHGGTARAVLAEPVPEPFSPPQSVNLEANMLARNVPERPFKCASCPTSTFSTLDTLKKHMSSRHGADNSQPGSPKSSNEIVDNPESTGEGGVAFKCHLCEASYGERNFALRHLATAHTAEYEQLVNKGALEAASDRSESADDDDRGKFPDHANRKVICAFCVRRFWSAEDLRRHMRTHSGERPFACDLCERRFTLKHSMLRHRKKHRDEPEPTDDDDLSPPNTPENTPNVTNGFRYDDESGNEIPSNVNNNNSPPAVPYEKKRKYSSEAENDGENSGDLIGNLLGIQDKNILNKLFSSPEEAAKFLGVNK